MDYLPLADRLQKLNLTFRMAGEPFPGYTAAEIASAATERLGREITAHAVQALLDGTSSGPEDVLEAIADLFHAPVSYLTGSAQEQQDYHTQLAFFETVAGTPISMIALRARNSTLSPAVSDALQVLIGDCHDKYGVPVPDGPR